MLLSLSGQRILSIPKKRQASYETRMRTLSAWDYLAIMAFFKETLDNATNDILVSSYLGSIHTPWPPPLDQIYYACGQSEQEAGFFFGLLLWQAVIDHGGTWFFKPADDVEGMVYFRPRRDDSGA